MLPRSATRLPPHWRALRCYAKAVILLLAGQTTAWSLGRTEAPANAVSGRGAATTTLHRTIPDPLPGHPGNVFLENEPVRIPFPTNVPLPITRWRLLDDQAAPVRQGELTAPGTNQLPQLALGRLGPGWYRVEFGTQEQPDQAWSTLAVLRRLQAPVPLHSPVSVDSAPAWFALNDPIKQKQLASLAALAGVNWIRDRLRWRDLQPAPGPLVPPPTTYDTSAEIHHAAGLQVLQVFHDTPPWTREPDPGSGRFAPDLRHVFQFGRQLAQRFKGLVEAWEPWNEANVATFGGHTVDQMCSWQKAAWLGFKAGNPGVTVGWNVTTAVPTPAQTEGILANETWPYFDTYNIHSYDWPDAYAHLWPPAREAASGRPLWITEADRGTPHLQNPPWYDQSPRLERLKAQMIAPAYANSLFAGARQHFHFILGNYQENNHIQFGLLREDLTPRPAYVALAVVGRCLAGARVLGRWQPVENLNVVAFRAQPDGQERDVLVAWVEKPVEWDERGRTTAALNWPKDLAAQEVVDYLGRSLGNTLPSLLGSAPIFVFLPAGQAETLPLERPPAPSAWRTGTPTSVVLQLSLPRARLQKVEDLPWSEGYVYRVQPGESLPLKLHVYNFGDHPVAARLALTRQPAGWKTTLSSPEFKLTPMDRVELRGAVAIPQTTSTRDGWVVLHADCGLQGRPALAFRIIVTD